MKNFLLALIIHNRNFRSDYTLVYLLGKTSYKAEYRNCMNSLISDGLLSVKNANGLFVYEPTKMGEEIIAQKSINKIIQEVEPYFLSKEYFLKLHEFFFNKEK